jgi:ABC transporter substrate binding protein
MYGAREFMEVGGLMAYQADQGELGRRMADDVHEILGGAQPGDIPIYQATKFELVINLKAAKSLGLNLPPALLAGGPSNVVALAGQQTQVLRLDPFSEGAHYHIRPRQGGQQLPLEVKEGQTPLAAAPQLFR